MSNNFLDNIKEKGLNATQKDEFAKFYTIGQGVYKGVLTCISYHRSEKTGKVGYKVVFKPAAEGTPENCEVKEITTYWFFDDKEDRVRLAMQVVNNSKQFYSPEQIADAIKNCEIAGKCYIAREREHTKDGKYKSNEWGYPTYTSIIIPAEEVDFFSNKYKKLEHLVVDEMKYVNMCNSKGLVPIYEKVENNNQTTTKGDADDNMPF